MVIFHSLFFVNVDQAGYIWCFPSDVPHISAEISMKISTKPTDLRGIGLGVCTITWRHGDRDFTSRQEVRFERRTPRPSLNGTVTPRIKIGGTCGEWSKNLQNRFMMMTWVNPGGRFFFSRRKHEKLARDRYRETFFLDKLTLYLNSNRSSKNIRDWMIGKCPTLTRRGKAHVWMVKFFALNCGTQNSKV